MSVVERLRAVQRGIVAACAEVGRDPAEVNLVAVSKRVAMDSIAAAAGAGQVDFGESYAQELQEKSASMPNLRWHYIGRVQRNKAKLMVGCHRVHAVTSVRQATALARSSLAMSGGNLHVLMAVNVGGEESKSGVKTEEALAVAEQISGVDGVALVGLMCLPPFTEDPEEASPFFEELSDLAARGRARGLRLNELSMGMSRDYRQAIRHGATWIRVGTAIFGERPSVQSAG